MAKHYDDKNYLLAEMKRRKLQAEKAIHSTFTAYMMLSCLTLNDDLKLEQEDIEKFINGIYKRIEEYESGNLTLDSMQKRLLDEVGVVVEMPKYED